MTLHLKQLSYSIGEKSLIKNISLCLETSTLYGIIGLNGSGKSTLLKTIARIWEPSSGELWWNTQNLLKASRYEISRILSLVPQNPQIHFDFSVAEIIAMGCYPIHTISSKILEEKIYDVLSTVDALHLLKRSFSTLSGGEKQRVYIARSLATESPVLLLDEPTSNLDPRHKIEIWHHLRNHAKKGKLILVATHDILTARHFCDQLIVLQGGTCKGNRPNDEALTPQIIQEVFGLQSLRELG